MKLKSLLANMMHLCEPKRQVNVLTLVNSLSASTATVSDELVPEWYSKA